MTEKLLCAKIMRKVHESIKMLPSAGLITGEEEVGLIGIINKGSTICADCER